MIPSIAKLLVLGSVLTIGLQVSALACGVSHGASRGLGGLHPMSMTVAVATVSARDAGLLVIAPVSGEAAGEGDSCQRMDRFATRCAVAFHGKPTAKLKILCIDTSVETYFQIAEDRAVEVHSAAEADQLLDVTVVTSEAAIRAISDGAVTPADAIAKGIVYVECASPGAVVFKSPIS
jgi:hypothetical protein